MKVLIARKEFVYYFAEYMYNDVHLVDVGERLEEFTIAAEKIDYIILASGELTSGEFEEVSIEDFANIFFEIKKRGQVVEYGRETLNYYCKVLNELLYS